MAGMACSLQLLHKGARQAVSGKKPVHNEAKQSGRKVEEQSYTRLRLGPFGLQQRKHLAHKQKRLLKLVPGAHNLRVSACLQGPGRKSRI
ncbi:hypothetical protein D3C81_1994880 [compost metagenome]